MTINYSKPKSEGISLNIVSRACADRAGSYNELTKTDAKAEANKWELSHGGISGRTAQQFINYVAGLEE